MKQVINQIKDDGIFILILFTVVWLAIFLNSSNIHQHFINNWIYVIGCFILSFPASALLTVLVVMLKIKLSKPDKNKRLRIKK